jgi:negative regulator of sigma E activity
VLVKDSEIKQVCRYWFLYGSVMNTEAQIFL